MNTWIAKCNLARSSQPPRDYKEKTSGNQKKNMVK